MARKRTTTPAEEGIELFRDSWARFERLADKLSHSGPQHREPGATAPRHPPKKTAGKAARPSRRPKARG